MAKATDGRSMLSKSAQIHRYNAYY